MNEPLCPTADVHPAGAGSTTEGPAKVAQVLTFYLSPCAGKRGARGANQALESRAVCLRAIFGTCYNHTAPPGSGVMSIMEKSG
ncbi:MAG: hypothetical protein AMJ93_04255 [Anaerolineae bacterium SM23_84]|nr:MAG: hypothetical protein AMJ93_04255 [Anaerolineae bacterium SM23_84]